MIMGNTPGTSLALDENRIRGYRNFSNKIWNASRFVLMNLEGFNQNSKPTLKPKDEKTLKNLNKTAKEITKLMNSFKFYGAAEKIYHYFWHTFADKIIEESKNKLSGKERKATQFVLFNVLLTSLKLLHPFMPFITEDIFQKLPVKNTKKRKKCLMVENWPK